MLGHNKKEPESPKQRPFSYDEIIHDMKETHGYGIDVTTGAQLRTFGKPGVLQPITMAPSIEYMLINEHDAKLVLKDTSARHREGEDRRPGGECHRLAARQDRETLAESGPMSKGDVVVDSQGRLSNVRRITEWLVPIQYSFAPNHSAPINVSGSISFVSEADVGEYRNRPHVDPLKRLCAAIGDPRLECGSQCKWRRGKRSLPDHVGRIARFSQRKATRAALTEPCRPDSRWTFFP